MKLLLGLLFVGVLTVFASSTYEAPEPSLVEVEQVEDGESVKYSKKTINHLKKWLQKPRNKKMYRKFLKLIRHQNNKKWLRTHKKFVKRVSGWAKKHRKNLIKIQKLRAARRAALLRRRKNKQRKRQKQQKKQKKHKKHPKTKKVNAAEKKAVAVAVAKANAKAAAKIAQYKQKVKLAQKLAKKAVKHANKAIQKAQVAKPHVAKPKQSKPKQSKPKQSKPAHTNPRSMTPVNHIHTPKNVSPKIAKLATQAAEVPSVASKLDQVAEADAEKAAEAAMGSTVMHTPRPVVSKKSTKK